MLFGLLVGYWALELRSSVLKSQPEVDQEQGGGGSYMRGSLEAGGTSQIPNPAAISGEAGACRLLGWNSE